MLPPKLRNFGPEEGMPEGQNIEFIGTQFDGINVWECPSWDTQHLKQDDIFKELENMPGSVKKYISDIVLSPFEHPDSDIEAFASACDISGHIIIYARPENRDHLNARLHEVGTLRHEAGHLIDRMIESDPGKERFSHGSKWAEARRLDCAVRKKPMFPIHWVSSDAEKYSKKYSLEWGLEEDFADSIRFFTGGPKLKNILKLFYPHRYKVINGLLK